MSRLAALLPPLTLAFAAACGGGGTAISQTSRGVAAPLAAPATAATGTMVVASDAPVPPADPRERIAFLREGSVWLMAPDGSGPVQLSARSTTEPDESPALSPRGDAVAYVSSRDGVSKIWVVSVDGRDSRALTDGTDTDGDPAWSPDGARIVFLRGDPRDQRDLTVLDLAGGAAPVMVLEGDDDEPTRVGAPAWSPDGARIALSADRRAGQGTGIWVVGVDGKGLRRVTPPRTGASFLWDAQPAWSPDGTRIAYASNRHVASADNQEDFDIYVSEVAGGRPLRLTQDAGAATDPDYSADGKRLYFVSTRDQRNPYEVELYVMPSGGGQQRRLTRDERPQNYAPSAGLVRAE